jgi:2-dehydropantoate 2-reductase
VRFVVYGAGAIGGVIGGCLHRAGHRTELIARGEHLAVMQERGLTLELVDETLTLRVPAVAGPGELRWDEPAVVVLAMKSQDTDPALQALSAVAPPETAVVCAQNGVENERRAARFFANTYAMCVMCATSHLAPGVVQAHSWPARGLLDLGRYPDGVDGTARRIAGALREAAFESEPLPSIMRWKYRKLLMNLPNSLSALCGNDAAGGEIAGLARQEGEDVLRAAGIDVASTEEFNGRRTRLLEELRPTASGAWQGGSTWQSVARGAGTVEADYLNGEIALLGRLHGVATPVNTMLQRRVAELARRGDPPGSVPPDELLAELAAV